MIVLIDVTCLKTAQAGVRRYTEGLLGALAHLQGDVQLRRSSAPVPRYGAPDSAWRKVVRHLLLLVWFQMVLPLVAAWHRADVLVCPEYYCPLWAPCPRIVIYYDSLFWERPEYPGWWKLLLQLNAVIPARAGALVATILDSNRAGVGRAVHRPAASVAVINPVVGIAPTSKPAPLPPGVVEPYLLHVGVLERRKSLPSLIRAHARAGRGRQGWPMLVLAGPRSPIGALDDYEQVAAAISETGRPDSVLMTGMVSADALSALYSRGLALLFPSAAEGFGLPVIEAMAHGLPVVATSSAVAVEVTGGAALLVADSDEVAFAESIGQVVGDADLRAELARRGLENARRYSLARVAADLDRLLAQVAH